MEIKGKKTGYFAPAIFEKVEGLLAVQTMRHGGISPAPFSALNLGINTKDLMENVQQNRALLCARLGIDWRQVAYTHQVHGADILYVTEAGGYSGYDALVTDKAGIFLAIGTADCAPVLVFDKKNRVSAAIHAGWRGAAADIVGKTMQYMIEHFSTAAADCLAYCGPCIGASVFEVGEEVAGQFLPVFSKKTDKKGKYLLDLKAVVEKQLLDFGLEKTQIEVDGACTFSNTADYFSYRKEGGDTGRMLGIIGKRMVRK